MVSPTAPARVVDSLQRFDRHESSGSPHPRDGVVLAASGDDAHKRALAMQHTPWPCLLAGGNPRRVPAATACRTPPTSHQGCPSGTCWRQQRRRPWHTLRGMPPGAKRTRLECRRRQSRGALRSGGLVHGGGAAVTKRPPGRRQYRAGHAGTATARQSVRGARRRWAMARVHKEGKQQVGGEEGATRGVAAGTSHVPGVDGADMGRWRSPPGVPPDVKAVGDPQRPIPHVLATNGTRPLLQPLRHSAGRDRSTEALRQALAGTCCRVSLLCYGLQRS